MSCSSGQVPHLSRAHSPPHFSLMCKKIPKLRDALAPHGLGSKTTTYIICALPGEKYGDAHHDVEIFYPPVHSLTNGCARRTCK